MAEVVINWINTILTLLLSTLVSLGANKFVVERNQKMRLHSEKLVNLSFKEWTRSMNNTANRGSEYDENRNEYVPFSAKNLLVPHSEFLISHVKSGYKDDWDKWTALLGCAYEFSNCEAQLKSMVLAEIIEFADSKRINVFYYKVGRDTPQQYIRPKFVVDRVMDELEYRCSGNEGKWIRDNKVIHQSAATPYYRVNFSESEVARTFTKRNADDTLKSIENIPDIETIHNKYDELMEIEKRYQGIYGPLHCRIEKIISEIELGLNLDGKCNACPGYI